MITEAAAELADESWRERAIIRHELAFFKLEPGRSRVHRFGVFAGEPIPAARDIIEYKGERVSRGQWVKRCADRTYLLRIDKYWAIDGSVGGSGAELVNRCFSQTASSARTDSALGVQPLREMRPTRNSCWTTISRRIVGASLATAVPRISRGTINV